MFDDQQPDEQNIPDLNINDNDNINDDNINENILDNINDIPFDFDNKEDNININNNININSNKNDSFTANSNEEIIDETPVTVQPVQFASFDEEENVHGKENRNLDLLMNVNLQMSVELGRTELPFKKVLELTRGSIISLDKLAGEPVELFANGKLVAFGEVVVIEDNFGLRITSIAAPEERLKTVHEATEKE